MAIYNIKLSNILYDWQLSIASFRFCKTYLLHIRPFNMCVYIPPNVYVYTCHLIIMRPCQCDDSAANAAPIKSVRSGIIDFELETKKDDGLRAVGIIDFELETKKNDGPDRVAPLVKNLVDEFSSARHQQLKMLSLYAMSNIGVNWHPLPRTAEFANLAPKFSFSQLEPAVMNEAYARIQKLVFRVQQTGSVGLLPSASSINTSHLPVLNYLLLKLHQA